MADARFQLVNRLNAEMAQERSGHLGEGTFDQIAPESLLGCVNVLE